LTAYLLWNIIVRYMLGQSARAGRLFALGQAFFIPVFFTGCTRAPSKPLFDLIITGGRIGGLVIEKGDCPGKEPGRVFCGPGRQGTGP